MRRAPCLLLLFALGCPEPTTEIVPYTTRDRRIDSAGAGNASRPRMCVVGTTVYVVWQDSRTGKNQVHFAAGRGGGSNWSEDVQLSDDPTGERSAENPEIACAGDSVYVVWEDDRDSDLGHRSIYFTYSDDAGRTFQNEELLDADVDGDWDSLEPRIAVDWDGASPDKIVHVVWYDNRFGAYDIFYNRGTNGYNWLPDEIRLDSDPPGDAYSAHPLLGTDGIGGVYVAWEDSRGGGNDVYLNRSFDWGHNWQGNDLRLDGGDASGASDAFGVRMAIDRDALQPGVYVAWHDDRNTGSDIYLNRSNDAGFTWQAEPSRIENDAPGAADSFYPSVVASDNEVLVAWHDDRDLGYDIWLRHSGDGGNSWDPEYRVDADVAGSAHSLEPQIARAGDRVAVGWRDLRTPAALGENGHPDVWFRVSDDGGFTWNENDVRVDDDPQSTAISEQQQMALAGPLLHFVWIDYRLGAATVWYRSMLAAGAGEGEVE